MIPIRITLDPDLYDHASEVARRRGISLAEFLPLLTERCGRTLPGRRPRAPRGTGPGWPMWAPWRDVRKTAAPSTKSSMGATHHEPPPRSSSTPASSFAAMNRRDEYHERARALFAGTQPRWHTSVLVWSEAYNWFLHRHGDEAARSFGSMVASLEGLVVFTADADHHAEVCRMSDRLRRARLTYVDASSLVLMDRHGIGTVWSTDTRLELTGAVVVPKPAG